LPLTRAPFTVPDSMKRLALVFLLAVVVAGGVFLARRAQTPSTAVSELLPRGTVFLAQLPDFSRTRDQWHESDLYKLYCEPAVQDFLGRPLSQLPDYDVASQTWREIEQLDPKDAFVAVTSIENGDPQFAGGLRFRGSRDDAMKIVNRWIGPLIRDESQHEMVDYQNHKIDIVGAAPSQIATVCDGQWVFVSNDLGELKAILDRADHREKDRQSTLSTNEEFRAARNHMPSDYAFLFYFQPKLLREKLAALPPGFRWQISDGQNAMFDEIGTICGATRLESGKMRDTVFIAAPKPNKTRTVDRSSVKLGTTNTLLYIAQLLNFERIAALSQSGGTTWLQKVLSVMEQAGVTLEDWNAAFEPEAATLADWPEHAHWPFVIGTISVKDADRADKVLNALTRAIDEDAIWNRTEKGGVRYFVMQTPASLIAISPTIALSNRLVVAGLDTPSVEAAINRAENGGNSSSLSNSVNYRSAASALPQPTNFFGYVDTALLYSRLDASLRPLLLMSAAFMPAMSNTVDVTKLPPQEVVTKHLSPIVSSQRYDRDGYVAESVGPVTLNQAALGLGAVGVWWTFVRPAGH
jgi:hypothetical protein